MKYIIGIDSGGTKTEAVAYTLDGRELKKVFTGFGNLLIDRQQGLEHIRMAIQEVFASYSSTDCQLIVLGLAGIDGSGLKDYVQSELACFDLPIVLLNDAQLAHYAFFKGQDGLLVIAGTGSVYLGKSGSIWARVGGWGHVFGDEGSAYHIGKLAIQQALTDEDFGRLPSELTQHLFTALQVTDPLTLVKVAYQLTKNQVADLATIVAQLAPQFAPAQAILSTAGKALAWDVEKLVTKLGMCDQSIAMGLNGSVIEKNTYVRHAFFAYLLEQRAFDLTVVEKATTNAKGAYYYYQMNGEKNK